MTFTLRRLSGARAGLAYTAAHWPMHAKPEDIAKYKGNYDAGYDAVRHERFGRLKQLGLIKPGVISSALRKQLRSFILSSAH